MHQSLKEAAEVWSSRDPPSQYNNEVVLAFNDGLCHREHTGIRKSNECKYHGRDSPHVDRVVL